MDRLAPGSDRRAPLRRVDFDAPNDYSCAPSDLEAGDSVGSVIKKRRKKMRKHKKRKLLRRARHKRKR